MKKKRRMGAEESTDEDGDVTALGCRVFFYADVTRGSILKLIRALGEANENAIKSGQAQVHIFIHSHGGDAYAGLSAMDHIRNNPLPVVTVADGMVASAASFMFLASGRRFILPHSFVRIHQVSVSGFEGKYADLVDEVQNAKVLMDMIKRVYVEHTHISEERIDHVLKQEIDMDAEQCKREGIVGEILTPL